MLEESLVFRDRRIISEQKSARLKVIYHFYLECSYKDKKFIFFSRSPMQDGPLSRKELSLKPPSTIFIPHFYESILLNRSTQCCSCFFGLWQDCGLQVPI